MNFILATNFGMPWKNLSAFVLSARHHAPEAQMVIFGSQLPPECQYTLYKLGAHLIPINFPTYVQQSTSPIPRNLLWSTTRFLTKLAGRKRRLSIQALTCAGGLLLPLNQARFFYYRPFIENCTSAGDLLLLCDARDIVFQADPFPNLPTNRLTLTEEEPRISIGQNDFNRKWYQETYGHKELKKIENFPVICAGVLGGERNALLGFTDRFIIESVRRGHRYGADQAIVNHLGRFEGDEHHLSPNAKGIAWHLSRVSRNEITFSNTGELTQPSGHTPPIIHMYDRHPDIYAAIENQWGAPNT